MALPTTLPTAAGWDDLAWRIDSEGIDAHTDDVRRFVATARAGGLTTVLLDVLLDGCSPAVVRERAYGVVSSRLAAIAAHPPRRHAAA